MTWPHWDRFFGQLLGWKLNAGNPMHRGMVDTGADGGIPGRIYAPRDFDELRGAPPRVRSARWIASKSAPWRPAAAGAPKTLPRIHLS